MVTLPTSPTLLAACSASIGLLCALLGVSRFVAGAPAAARKVVPLSGGLLVGIALFGVWPELAELFGWPAGLGLIAIGTFLLWLFGKYVYPVCPSCSHTHDHEHCELPLHGFALPLVIAACIHAFLDGLGIAASQQEHAGDLGMIVLVGVALHKVPEGLALGVILREALKAPGSALSWCTVIQSCTVLGGLLEALVGDRMGVRWVSYALALAAGSFLYLGFHAVHGEWRRRGAPALAPALGGAAGAAALLQGLHMFLR